VGPRAGLYDMEKFLTLPGLELRPLRRPARSQSLYRLRYPNCQYETLILRAVRTAGSYNHQRRGSSMDQQLLPEPIQFS
jgi:hypothetical protein